MEQRKLTFAESLVLVAGAGIGTGLLTIPYAISKIGFFGTLTALILAIAVSAVLYLMIADLALHSEGPLDLISILDQHLFRGRKPLKLLFFVMLVLLLLENLVVYILCAANVTGALLGWDTRVSMVIFYVIASAVMAFGIKGMGLGEKFSVALIGGAVILLGVLACFHIKGEVSFGVGQPSVVFAVYGLFMFAFSAIFSVVQVCQHIKRPELTRKAVLGGLGLNAIITLLFSFAVIIGSDNVTEIAIVGLADGIGMPVVKVICLVMVLMAMLSSFWSGGLAFADVVGEQFSMKKIPAWLISTVPALLLAMFLPLSVLDYIQIGAGALSVILVIVVLPAYVHAVSSVTNPLLGKAARSKALLIFMAIAILLMAVSSLIPID